MKPSELSPLSAIKLVKELKNCGLPENFIKVITTSKPEKIFDELFKDDKIEFISFTGSYNIGNKNKNGPLSVKATNPIANDSKKKKNIIPDLGNCSTCFWIEPNLKLISSGIGFNTFQWIVFSYRNMFECSSVNYIVNTFEGQL